MKKSKYYYFNLKKQKEQNDINPNEIVPQEEKIAKYKENEDYLTSLKEQAKDYLKDY